LNKNGIFSYYSGAEHYLYNTTQISICRAEDIPDGHI
jgi:hypothetical protein